MNGWKLERLRMTRTPRAIALAGTYLFFGLLGPVTAKYLQDIVNRLGTLAAWYETPLLLGPPPPGAMLAGLLCGSAYLIFAVSVATAAASVARSTFATIGILLALPLLGMAGPLHTWLPRTLVTAPIALFGSSTLGGYLPPRHRRHQRPLLLTAAAFQLKRRDV